MTAPGEPPPFLRHAPPGPALPVVFDSPHRGFHFPPDFAPSATRVEIRTTWDACVDELCAGVTAAGATLLAATFPRAHIDAHRAADDTDPEVPATP
jgi:N-formylglutamate deformylase